MPFKSKAQRRKFAELLVNRKISDQVYEEWNRSTGKKELPERLHPEKKTTKRKTKAGKARISPKGKARTRKRTTRKTR